MAIILFDTTELETFLVFNHAKLPEGESGP